MPARLGSPIREPGYVTYVKRGRKRLLISDVQSGRPDGRSTIWVKGAMGAQQFSNCERLAVLSWTDKHAVLLPVVRRVLVLIHILLPVDKLSYKTLEITTILRSIQFYLSEYSFSALFRAAHSSHEDASGFQESRERILLESFFGRRLENSQNDTELEG
ncbi:hypothetical protein L596_012100 [Steinernema carpocapsae]|uniref:Uncharacterized protein n=1 Tax=Steinernema carpocapsae TaxID=34508 RepID=A0A4U5NW38_STECR|nr:hypothetical protein L596_012100 [Steinernema carpocapsae]